MTGSSTEESRDIYHRKLCDDILSKSEVPWLDQLFSRRLIFVMGKGGVGKTTLSVALGLAAERIGKKVLLLEIGDTDAIGSIFNNKSLPEIPLKISRCIWGARVNPKAELESYTHAFVNSGFIANRITKSRLFDYLAAATPGLKEVMSLGRIWRWEKKKNKLLENVFDLIIVDAPATGHALSLLRLPDVLIEMIRVGPLVAQIRRIQHLLADHRKTCISLVTLPEELPVNEAMEFYSAARDDLRMSVAVTFINCVYPLLFTQNEILQIKSFKDRLSDDPYDPRQILLSAANSQISRKTIQQTYINRINSNSTGHVKEMPFYFSNDLTLSDIDRLSQEF